MIMIIVINELKSMNTSIMIVINTNVRSAVTNPIGRG